jgi:hypothetical protein
MTMRTDSLAVAEHEARAYAAWLIAHGYHEATTWRFSTALNNYGLGHSRAICATGYAVRYAGTLVRDNGSTAEYPTAGVTVFCQDDQLPISELIQDGRALAAFSSDSGATDAFLSYTPYYVASWNPRETDLQRNPAVNPGTLPLVILHELTPGIAGDGPMRFFDLRLVPAGDLATGDRVRVVSGTHGGLQGVITHPDARRPMVELDPVYDPAANTTRPWGSLHQVSRADLEPGDTCADGHALRWDAESYATPRWVHVSGADLMTCTTVMADPGSLARTMPDYGDNWPANQPAACRQHPDYCVNYPDNDHGQTTAIPSADDIDG